MRVRVDPVTAPLVLDYVNGQIVELLRRRGQARDSGGDVKPFNFILHRLFRLKDDLRSACETMGVDDERPAATG